MVFIYHILNVHTYINTHTYIYILRSTTLPLFLPKPNRALYIFCHWFNWNVLPITTASKLNKKLT